MAEAFVNVTEGSGKKLHAFDRTIGANTVLDEVVVLGEQYLASYSARFSAISVATDNDHILQIMAGASLKVRIRKIAIYQQALASAANELSFGVLRLTTAGTGGTSVTPQPYDTADAASGAAAMTLPSAKGTEASVSLLRFTMALYATEPAGRTSNGWEQLPTQKPIIIPAGTSNGIALKITTGRAGATVSGFVEFDESSF